MTHRPTTPRDPGRRRRILDAARQHFSRHGFRAARLDEIAREAGCAKGALYLEFESKEALLAEVAREVLASAEARFRAEVLSVPGPLERLRATLRFTFREMDREPLFERLSAEDPTLSMLKGLIDAPDQQARADAQIAMLSAWIAEGIAAGEIRADLDREALPFALASLRAVHLQGDAATGGRLPRARLMDTLIDLFIAGLRAPQHAAR